jgi:hypothetical protein
MVLLPETESWMQMIKAVALADKRYELHLMLVESRASSTYMRN